MAKDTGGKNSNGKLAAWNAPELIDLHCDLDQVAYTFHGTVVDGATRVQEPAPPPPPPAS